jgi:hypothetical protein
VSQAIRKEAKNNTRNSKRHASAASPMYWLRFGIGA